MEVKHLPKKPTIKQIKDAYHIPLDQLARMADIEPRVAYLASIGAPVTLLEATRVLGALNHLTGQSLLFSDVLLRIRPRRAHADQPTRPLRALITSRRNR